MKYEKTLFKLTCALVLSGFAASNASADFPCQWYKVTTGADGKPQYIERGKTVDSDTPQPASDLKCFGVCPSPSGTGSEPCPQSAQKCIQMSFKSRGQHAYEHDCSCKIPAPSGPPTVANLDANSEIDVCSDPRNNPVPLYFNLER